MQAAAKHSDQPGFRVRQQVGRRQVAAFRRTATAEQHEHRQTQGIQVTAGYRVTSQLFRSRKLGCQCARFLIASHILNKYRRIKIDQANLSVWRDDDVARFDVQVQHGRFALLMQKGKNTGYLNHDRHQLSDFDSAADCLRQILQRLPRHKIEDMIILPVVGLDGLVKMRQTWMPDCSQPGSNIRIDKTMIWLEHAEKTVIDPDALPGYLMLFVQPISGCHDVADLHVISSRAPVISPV